MKWALITNGIVQNIIVPPITEDVQFLNYCQQNFDSVVEISDDVFVGPGLVYDGTLFSDPQGQIDFVNNKNVDVDQGKRDVVKKGKAVGTVLTPVNQNPVGQVGQDAAI